MAYELKNVSSTQILENLATKDASGKLEVLLVGVRKTVTVTDEQFASPAVQRHIQRGRLRVRKTN